jgi:hypothetical protein
MKKTVLISGIAFSSFFSSQVGINTASPTAALDIISKGNTSSTKALKVSNSSGNEMTTILDNSNVGIGIMNPLYNLEIGDFLNNGAFFSLSQTGMNTNGQSGITFFTKRTSNNSVMDATSKGWKWFSLSDAYTTNPALANSLFLEGWTNGIRTQNIFVANPNGNIGFGIQEPTAKIHINASNPGTGFRLVDGSQGPGKILSSDVNGNASWQEGQNSQYQRIVAAHTSDIQMAKATANPNYTTLAGLVFTPQSAGRYLLNLHLFVKADNNPSIKTFYFKVFQNGINVFNSQGASDPEVYTYVANPPGASDAAYLTHTLPSIVYLTAGQPVTFGFTDGLVSATPPVSLTFLASQAYRNNIEVVYLGK